MSPNPARSPLPPRVPASRRGPSAATLALLIAALLLGLLATGCHEQQERPEAERFTPLPRAVAGPPRAYRLGFSAFPAALTDEAYLQTFDLAANFGEVLLLPRQPSWGDFLPGAAPSEALIESTIAEREAVAARGLALMLALDPFDPADRGRLVAPPPGYEGRDLSDPDLRQALVAEAKYIALNYRPAYLLLGTEVNATFERDPAAYAAFMDAYREAYDVVKAESPTTQVFASFQYEQLLGIVPWQPPHAPRWELLDGFGSRLDAFAITTYPSFAYSVARKVPPDYYSQAQEHTALPLAMVSVGYASAPGREGLNASTAAEQRRFVERLFADADALAVPLVIWFAARDPDFASAPPYDLLGSIGLRTTEDEAKEAWALWERALSRPYDPVAAAAAAAAATATAGTSEP